MSREEWYRRFIQPYAKYLLVLEFLSVPAIALIAFAIGGKLIFAVIVAATWIIADLLFTALFGCSLLGIFVRCSLAEVDRFPPGTVSNLTLSRRTYTFIYCFMVCCMAVFGFALAYTGYWFSAFFFPFTLYNIAMARMQLNGMNLGAKQYEKQAALYFGFLALPMLFCLALFSAGFNVFLAAFIGLGLLAAAGTVTYFGFQMLVKKKWQIGV